MVRLFTRVSLSRTCIGDYEFHNRRGSIASGCVTCGYKKKHDKFNELLIFEFSFARYGYFKRGYYCQVCMFAMENDFIQKMPEWKIPLYINHGWVMYGSKEFFIDRLKGVGQG